MIAILLVLAFCSGLLFRKLGQPPLLGYLIAGFVANAMGMGDIETLAPIADIGVTMLLFTIGLKLRTSELIKPYIIAPALLHMLMVVPFTAAVLLLFGLLYPPLAFDSVTPAWMLAFALSFSSTVFAIKMFDERGENSSFYASITIGVLVIQDVLAVIYLVLLSGNTPSVYALGLLLLPVLARFWKPMLSRFLAAIGHGELQLLFGFLAALGSYELFELLQLKGGLGALVAGVVIGAADNLRSRELYKRLVSFTNLFLIGFFLQIGFHGFPSISMLLVALLLGSLILFRPVIYFALFTVFRLRARTSWLAGIGLFTYSEFGLIVASVAVSSGHIDNEWLVTLALAIAISFFLSTPVNKMAHKLYRRHAERLDAYEKSPRLTEETIDQLGDASIVVLGMGRVGKGVYNTLNEARPGSVVGVEEDTSRLQQLRENGFHCVHGDATDRDFWERTVLADRGIIFVNLSNHRENLTVVKLARQLGYTQTLAVPALFEDEKKELEDLGCVSFNVFANIGSGFAAHVLNLTAPEEITAEDKV